MAVGIVSLALPYLPIAAATGFQPLPPGLLLTLLVIVIAYVLASELLKTRIGAFQSRRTSRGHRRAPT